MRGELVVLVVTAFFVFDAYHDGKYVSLLKKGKKYYKMIGIAFAGFSTYLFLKKNPREVSGLVTSAAGVMRTLPVDQRPLRELMETCVPQGGGAKGAQGIERKKRSVSETKKKFVASNQDWKCGECNSKLTAWFEVDHKVRLDRGGSNEVANLVALCRNCHGKKTALENM
tara:strand:+ start:210 stop:719 length:510 start_codon:yes stop_codon:yes gene_type:complete